MSLTKELKAPPNILTPRFLISGQAVGVSAFVTRSSWKDGSYVIPVLGASALPTIGGYSKDIVEGPASKEYAPFVSFSRAETESQGNYQIAEQSQRCEVKSRSMVRGLSVVGRFNADFLQATVQLKHPGGREQPTFFVEGQFGSIRLDDEIIRVHIDKNTADWTTEKAIAADFKKNQPKAKFFHGEGQKFPPGQVPRLSGSGYIMYSIVGKIDIVGKDPKKPTKAKAEGHIVRLPGFGAIYFGEIMVRPESRKLTMLRMELGCADEGRLAICMSDSMGETCPP